MKTTEETTVWYVADDGTKFLAQKDCIAHEKDLLGSKWFSVYHAFDCTEERGYQSQMVVRFPGNNLSANEWLHYYMTKAHGPQYQMNYNSPVKRWVISDITLETAKVIGKSRQLGITHFTGYFMGTVKDQVVSLISDPAEKIFYG